MPMGSQNQTVINPARFLHQFTLPKSSGQSEQNDQTKPSERTGLFDHHYETIIQRETHKVALSRSDIESTVMDFKAYKDFRRTLRNLARFDDCSQYGIETSVMDSYLRKEIDKLIQFAESEQPPLFNSSGALDGVEEGDFAGVSGLADQIMCNMHILQSDNARLVVDECGSRVPPAWDMLLESRDVLKDRYSLSTDSSRVEGHEPVSLNDPSDNYKAYSLLVDYAFGAIAWWMARSVSSSYLNRHILATLAQWSFKLKVVATAPAKNAEQALSNTQGVMLQYKDIVQWNDDMVVLKLEGKERQFNALNDNTDSVMVYFEEKLLLRKVLQNVLFITLHGLYHSPRLGSLPNCFETCTIVYRTGLDGVTTLVKGLRHGNVLATSNLTHINFCYSAYQLLHRNTESIACNSPHTQETPPPGAAYVMVTDSSHKGDPSICLRNVNTMDQVVSILAPNGLMSPEASMNLTALINIATIQADSEERIMLIEPPPRRSPLRQLTFGREMADGTKRDDKNPIRYSSPLEVDSHSNNERDTQRIRADYEAAWDIMRSWEVGTSSVRVDCKGYVAAVAFTAACFVAVGLVACFTVGERIEGVDPGQLAGYSCDVSGISEQIILMYFLQNEWKTLLQTCGPYNGMFKRISKDGGFSIDVPTHTSTILASGFVLLKVRSDSGEHLICIDGRKGGFDAARTGHKGKWLTCPDFQDDYLEQVRGSGLRQADVENKVFLLRRREFAWRKVLGIYVRDCRFG
ncbi:hypothetical protein E8E14_006142 [Neopestalotiopsis sp. 37M]|nr:hypothetical protein E8E14_006142 [Neopestalotiopsis sp. 37M]